MTPQSTTEEGRDGPANNDATAPATTVKKSGLTAKEKKIPVGEILPGWTTMQPLRGTAEASAAATTASHGVGVDRKDNSDVKVTEINGAGYAYDDVGEVEAVQQIEFLGPHDGGGQRRRTAPENGDPADHPLQSNDAASVERIVTGAGE